MCKIILCALATDDIILYQSKLRRARAHDPNNKEFILLENLSQAIINYNTKSFTEIAENFSSQVWTTQMLSEIKSLF